jgi:hypothetical protein
MSYAYTAKLRHTWPYKIFSFSEMEYVSHTRSSEFTRSLTCRDRHEINNYSQLPSMPPNKMQRSQLRVPNTGANIESLWASLSQITSIPTGCVSVLPPPRPKLTRNPAILTMTKKTKIIQPYQRARIIKAETTSCQRSPKMPKRRCLNSAGCYLNFYSNNKLYRKLREP